MPKMMSLIHSNNCNNNTSLQSRSAVKYVNTKWMVASHDKMTGRHTQLHCSLSKTPNCISTLFVGFWCCTYEVSPRNLKNKHLQILPACVQPVIFVPHSKDSLNIFDLTVKLWQQILSKSTADL